jgi:hypothetical protein
VPAVESGGREHEILRRRAVHSSLVSPMVELRWPMQDYAFGIDGKPI